MTAWQGKMSETTPDLFFDNFNPTVHHIVCKAVQMCKSYLWDDVFL